MCATNPRFSFTCYSSHLYYSNIFHIDQVKPIDQSIKCLQRTNAMFGAWLGLTFLDLQSRIGDEALELLSTLSLKRDYGPKRVNSRLDIYGAMHTFGQEYIHYIRTSTHTVGVTKTKIEWVGSAPDTRPTHKYQNKPKKTQNNLSCPACARAISPSKPTTLTALVLPGN